MRSDFGKENGNQYPEGEYRRRVQAALRAAEICIFEVDIVQQRYTFFENAESIFHKSGEQILTEVKGYETLPPEEYQDAVSAYFSHPDDKEVIDKAFEAIFAGRGHTYEARMKAGDQDYTWCQLSVAPVMEDGSPAKMVGVISNIQMTRDRMSAMESAASKDPFTLLCNKERLIELTNLALGEARERDFVMMVIDLDRFKNVNDTYGHMAGDQVLLSVANHLKGLFRKTDIVARFGGDEFVVLMMDCDAEAALDYVKRLMEEPDNDYAVTKSVGVAVRKPEDTSFSALFARADRALYEAKKTRNTCVVHGDGTR